MGLKYFARSTSAAVGKIVDAPHVSGAFTRGKAASYRIVIKRPWLSGAYQLL